MKKRIIGTVIVVLAAAAAAAAAFALGIDPPVQNIAGSFVSIAVFLAAAKVLKVDDTLFFSGLVFVFMASPLGSVINLYRYFSPYDKIVHLTSGFLLAAFGMFIMEKLLTESAKVTDLTPFFVPMLFAACMFSSGGAGLWEIFEFLGDKISGSGMQRGMVDTVTDMIAGNIGAVLYGALWAVRSRRTQSVSKNIEAETDDIIE